MLRITSRYICSSGNGKLYCVFICLCYQWTEQGTGNFCYLILFNINIIDLCPHGFALKLQITNVFTCLLFFTSVNMSAPKPAGTAEILRSFQTDEFHLRNLRNLTAEIIQRCLGLFGWIQYTSFIFGFYCKFVFSICSKFYAYSKNYH